MRSVAIVHDGKDIGQVTWDGEQVLMDGAAQAVLESGVQVVAPGGARVSPDTEEFVARLPYCLAGSRVWAEPRDSALLAAVSQDAMLELHRTRALERARGGLRLAPKPVASSPTWDETKHPREPAGTEKGGEFAPKGSTYYGVRLTEGKYQAYRMTRGATKQEGKRMDFGEVHPDYQSAAVSARAASEAEKLIDWSVAEKEFAAFKDDMAQWYTGKQGFPPDYFPRQADELWRRYQEGVLLKSNEIVQRLTATGVTDFKLTPQLSAAAGGDLDQLGDTVGQFSPDFDVELKAEGGDAPGFTIWTHGDGTIEVEDVLDITDTDFFPDGPDSPLVDRYVALVDAARGADQTGYVTLHRGMTDTEADQWNAGAEIPLGKFFTDIPTVQYAADRSGAPPALYTFKVPRAMVTQTGPNEFQLKKKGRLDRGEILQASGWEETRHPRHPAGSSEGGEFTAKATVLSAFGSGGGLRPGEFTSEDVGGVEVFTPLVNYTNNRYAEVMGLPVIANRRGDNAAAADAANRIQGVLEKLPEEDWRGLKQIDVGANDAMSFMGTATYLPEQDEVWLNTQRFAEKPGALAHELGHRVQLKQPGRFNEFRKAGLGRELEHVMAPGWAAEFGGQYGRGVKRDAEAFAESYMLHHLDPDELERRSPAVADFWRQQAMTAAAWDESKHPREAAGSEKGGEFASDRGLPAAPGTAPIPAGHVRLYHYTGAPPEVIRHEGIKISSAKGENYGEPNQIWSSTRPPDFQIKNVVEFSAATDDPRMNIGRFEPGVVDREGIKYTPETWARDLPKRGSDVTFMGDIRPDEMIAVHEPWQQAARYIQENYPNLDLATLDDLHLTDIDPIYAEADRYLRQGLTAAGWDESKHPRYPAGDERGGEFAPKYAATEARLGRQPDGRFRVSKAPNLREFLENKTWHPPKDILEDWPNLNEEQAERLKDILKLHKDVLDERGNGTIRQEAKWVLRDLAEAPGAAPELPEPVATLPQQRYTRSLLDTLTIGGGRVAPIALDAARTIDATIAYPKVPGEPRVEIKGVAGGTSRQAALWRGRYDKKPNKITVATSGVNPLSSTVHELGHYLDSLLGQDSWAGLPVASPALQRELDETKAAYGRAQWSGTDPDTGEPSWKIQSRMDMLITQAGGGPRREWEDYSSEQARGTLKPVLDSIRGTSMYHRLEEYANARGASPYTFEYGGRSFSPGRAHVRYLLNNPEMIARSFEQYIAAKNPGSKLANSSRHVFSDTAILPPEYPGYMNGVDLETVNAAWDKLLEERGLLKKPGLQSGTGQRSRRAS